MVVSFCSFLTYHSYLLFEGSFSNITQLLCEGMHFSEPLDAEGHYFVCGLLDECLTTYLTQGGDTGSRPSSFLGF